MNPGDRRARATVAGTDGAGVAAAAVPVAVPAGDVEAGVTITGVDDRGASPGSAVTLAAPAGASRTLGAAELESGGEGFAGALGDRTGKWRLRVVSDRPILAMSLLESSTGHLTNLSGAPGRGMR